MKAYIIAIVAAMIVAATYPSAEERAAAQAEHIAFCEAEGAVFAPHACD